MTLGHAVCACRLQVNKSNVELGLEYVQGKLQQDETELQHLMRQLENKAAQVEDETDNHGVGIQGKPKPEILNPKP